MAGSLPPVTAGGKCDYKSLVGIQHVVPEHCRKRLTCGETVVRGRGIPREQDLALIGDVYIARGEGAETAIPSRTTLLQRAKRGLPRVKSGFQRGNWCFPMGKSACPTRSFFYFGVRAVAVFLSQTAPFTRGNGMAAKRRKKAKKRATKRKATRRKKTTRKRKTTRRKTKRKATRRKTTKRRKKTTRRKAKKKTTKRKKANVGKVAVVAQEDVQQDVQPMLLGAIRARLQKSLLR